MHWITFNTRLRDNGPLTLERRFALLPKKVIGGFTTWLQFYYVVIEWYQPYPSILPEEWRFKSKLGEFLNLETAEMAFEDKHL